MEITKRREMIPIQNILQGREIQDHEKDQEHFPELAVDITMKSSIDLEKGRFPCNKESSKSSEMITEDQNIRCNVSEKGTRGGGRVNTLKIKAQLQKSLGPERAMLYFRVFSRFLSHQMAKPEYVEAMEQIIEKENISLHNHLIRSILQNAACSEETAGPSAK